MAIGDLIPISGASKGTRNLTKEDTQSLTSGLISIAGARDHDVDMSDFDVGDLLDEDSSTTKLKSASTSKSVEKKDRQLTDDLKRATSSKKKKKSKSKAKKSKFDDDASHEDGKTSTKKWDSVAELEMAAARRKDGGKRSSGLNDELERMLNGRETDFTSIETFQGASLQQAEMIDTLDTGDSKSDASALVRNRKETDGNEVARFDGIASSFFDEKEKDGNAMASFVTTERRGTARGGRRQARGGDLDPFDRKPTTTSTGSTLQKLFGDASTLRRDFDDLFSKPLRTGSNGFERQNGLEATTASETRPTVSPFRDTALTERVSAKDELLADLGAPDAQSTHPKSVFLETKDVKEEEIEANAWQSQRAIEPAKGQSDQLTESLFSPPLVNHLDTRGKEELNEQVSLSATEKALPSFQRELSGATDQRTTSLNVSAKDSLLMDLLGDLSATKSIETLPAQRRSSASSGKDSPLKEAPDLVETFDSNVKIHVDTKIVETPRPTSLIERHSPVHLPASRTMIDNNMIERDGKRSQDRNLADNLPVADKGLVAMTAPEVTNDRKSEKPEGQSALILAQSLKPGNFEAPNAPPICHCSEREAAFTAAFDTERAAFHLTIDTLTQQIKTQAAASAQQIKDHEAAREQLCLELDARRASHAELTQQLAVAARQQVQAEQDAATWHDNVASAEHRAALLETQVSALRDELLGSKRAHQEAEATLGRLQREQHDVDQLERHREKRAFEALRAQLHQALARLSLVHQVHDDASGAAQVAARAAAEDDARLRVIATLEASAKRAAHDAEHERLKLTALLRELEQSARLARQGAVDEQERLRQEHQRLDAWSAHLQAQATALRDHEAAHAASMGAQLAQAREDFRVQDARVATRRTELERDERALYQARAEFAAFREQTAGEVKRERDEVQTARVEVEAAWRALDADREAWATALASHEGAFQALASERQDLHDAEARLKDRTHEVVVLAEQLDAGTRALMQREELVAQQAARVYEMDTAFQKREQALARVKTEVQTREQRVHVQLRQLDTARERLVHERKELVARKSRGRGEQVSGKVRDNNRAWRQSARGEFMQRLQREKVVRDNGEKECSTCERPFEEDPSGLSPALRKQVEANWARRKNESVRPCAFQFNDVDPLWYTKFNVTGNTGSLSTPRKSKPATELNAKTLDGTNLQLPPPTRLVQSPLRVNL